MANEEPFYFELPPEQGGGIAKVNMDACRGHGAGARKCKEVGTISKRTGHPRKRHILEYSLDELRHMGWSPGGLVAFSHSQKQWFPFIPGHDSDSDESYAPVEEFKGFMPGGRISASASYQGLAGGQPAASGGKTGPSNACSPANTTKKKKKGKLPKVPMGSTLSANKDGSCDVSSVTVNYKDMSGDRSKLVSDQFIENAMHHLCNFPCSDTDIRSILVENGTNVTLNDADSFGDGDQRPLQKETQRQAHRDIWSAGGNVVEHFESGAASAFARACLCGDLRFVRDHLHGLEGHELMQVLEKRETSMRLSPIFFCIIGPRHIPASHAVADVDHLGVAGELLHKGARPDARDFCGKTVVHYGAGGVATPLSLSIVHACLMKAEQRGLVAPSLLDMQDRTGAVSLIDVIMMGRTDVAKWLLARNASAQIVDLDGISPESMVNPLFNREMAVAFSEGGTSCVQRKRKDARSCSCCGTEAGPMIHLQLCSGCKRVGYCSKVCQKKAWKAGHKFECSRLASGDPVKLQKPDKRKQSKEEQMFSQWQVTLPKGVNHGDRFWIKAQVPPPGALEPILMYDESQSVLIHYLYGPGHAEVVAKVRTEGALGRKGHFEAFIDDLNNIYVDTSHMKMKCW
eukprot:TRINITY_DN42476_c0_g1_i1.p1 TRINITY_DN42476_c0_g1~~TRINITY_DN42476_c0_g1_i1.p1  ORF type:complete len:629 (-),score=55.14 TRINITY_DN42476_c0_g1_i1:199-2085(-)